MTGGGGRPGHLAQDSPVSWRRKKKRIRTEMARLIFGTGFYDFALLAASRRFSRKSETARDAAAPIKISGRIVSS